MNPALKKLGYDKRDRVVIIHADDVGMCQATLPALTDLLDAGLISSAATMVPCSWFPAVAAVCRGHSDVDMGVHLTLTCEYRSYRWGPISTRQPASGLMDEAGYFHFDHVGAQTHAASDAAAREMAAQVARARAAGIDVTHIDTHQISAYHPKFLAAYTGLAVDNGLPLLLLRLDALRWQALGQALGFLIDLETARLLEQAGHDLEAQGVPLLDHITGLPLDRPEDRVAQARQMFESLPPGLTHLVLHPAVDTPELRAIAPDWPGRVADYQAFTSPELRQYVRSSGLQIIGYRELRRML
ncbi:MAG TPA: ChbG/HpnK family deacetylase [Anaerolineae bacterium]|nr:ChbG/HpnK family deacetylase [Anaerolineae bacterium]